MCHNAFALSKSQDVLVYMGCTHQHINIWDWVSLQMIALQQYQTWLAGISASACWTFPSAALPPYLCASLANETYLESLTCGWMLIHSDDSSSFKAIKTGGGCSRETTFGAENSDWLESWLVKIVYWERCTVSCGDGTFHGACWK